MMCVRDLKSFKKHNSFADRKRKFYFRPMSITVKSLVKGKMCVGIFAEQGMYCFIDECLRLSLRFDALCAILLRVAVKATQLVRMLLHKTMIQGKVQTVV